jgi:hypothetical protein
VFIHEEPGIDLLRLLTQASYEASEAGAESARARGRWLILGTFRAAEVGASPGLHPLAVLLKELRMHERCIELPLEVLGEASVAAYLRARQSRASTLRWPKAGTRTSTNPRSCRQLWDSTFASGSGL